jgi:hypothetical protein
VELTFVTRKRIEFNPRCPTCGDRMKLLAMVPDRKSITRYLAKIGEPTERIRNFA